MKFFQSTSLYALALLQTSSLVSGSDYDSSDDDDKAPSLALGSLTDFLFVFLDGSKEVKLEIDGSSGGYGGDIAVNGAVATLKSNDKVPYAGKIYTSSIEGTPEAMGDWQDFLDSEINVDNDIKVLYDRAPLFTALETDFNTALEDICDLTATKGFEAFDAEQAAEDYEKSGDIVLDFKDGKNEMIVINVLDDKMHLKRPLPVNGDAGDLFVFRWGYYKDEFTGLCTYAPSHKVEFKDTGGVFPQGLVQPDRLIHAAGNIDASGGDPMPTSSTQQLAPYPTYGADKTRVAGTENDWGDSVYFIGYWLTTGKDNRETESLGDAVFIGGWYTSTIKVNLKKGGVHVPQRFKRDISQEFDVLVQCNILDNPCFDDKNDLRAIGLRDVTEALVIQIAETAPGAIDYDGDHEDDRKLRSLRGSTPSTSNKNSNNDENIQRQLGPSRMRCYNPWFCGHESILYGRRRHLKKDNAYDFDKEFSEIDSVENMHPFVKEHHSMTTLLKYYGYPITPKQRQCITDTYCQLTYYEY